MDEKQGPNRVAQLVLDDPNAQELTLWQSIRKWRTTVLMTLAVASVILMFGYDDVIVVTVSAMPSFQRDFGEDFEGQMIIPSFWLAIWSFVTPGAGMLGNAASGTVMDRLGRRGCIGLGSFLSVCSVAVCYVAYLPAEMETRRGVFLAGKGFQGAALGLSVPAAQAYMSETLPPSLRGPLLAFFPVFTLLGQLVGSVVIYLTSDLARGYNICFITQWPISLAPLVLVLFLVPESPTYLVRRGRLEDALRAQRRLDRPGMPSEKTVEILRRNIEHEREVSSAGYADAFRGTNLRRTMLVVFGNLQPQLLGHVLLSKAAYFLQLAGMDADLSLMLLIGALVLGCVANVSGIWVLSRVGRRRLILASVAAVVFLWAGVGVGGFFSQVGRTYWAAACMMAIVVVSGVGVWPASVTLAAETSTLHLRSKSVGIGWVAGGAATAFLNFCLPYIFSPDQGDLGLKTGFVFAGLNVVSWLLSWFHVPELKGRTTAEIDEMFELRLGARRFRSWTVDDARA